MLRLKNICYRIGKSELLHDVSVELQPGEVLAIVGANGAGKTTLLQAVLGDIRLSSGAVYFAGRQIQQWALAERAKRMAILPQLSLLNFPYSVSEVVAMGRTPHSSGRAVDSDIVQAAMAAMDITHLQQRLYTELSGGEKQRTQLARVMAQIWRAEDAAERLLVLDEPTSSLDLGHKQQLMQAVRKFANQGAMVVMVEHDIGLAANYADSMLALSNGRSSAYGSCAEVFQQELVQQLFGANVHLWRDAQTGKTGIAL